jgi:transcriptional regulator with XRE-family HTH domain
MRKTKNHRNDSFLQHLGDAIRTRRIKLLLSQAELGSRADFHRTYITDIENGLRNISIMTLRKIAGALDGPLSSPIIAAERSMHDKTSWGKE